MKLKIWDEKEVNNKDESQLYLRLMLRRDAEKENDRDDICMYLCKKDGKPIKDGLIMAFDNTFNCFILADNIPHGTPIKTDAVGYPITAYIKDMRDYYAPEIQIHQVVVGTQKQDEEYQSKH